MTDAGLLARERQRGRLDAEPLEDRSLLSGLMSPAQAAPLTGSVWADIRTIDQAGIVPGDGVQLMQIIPVSDDPASREIAVHELPQRVVSATTTHFPGTLSLAEVDERNGALFFEVTTELDGAQLDVTLSADGNVIEIRRPLGSLDLPQPVVEWIERNFPGASVREAELVASSGAVQYEVLIATPLEESFEATLRLPGDGWPSNARAADMVAKQVPFLPLSSDAFGFPHLEPAVATAVTIAADFDISATEGELPALSDASSAGLVNSAPSVTQSNQINDARVMLNLNKDSFGEEVAGSAGEIHRAEPEFQSRQAVTDSGRVSVPATVPAIDAVISDEAIPAGRWDPQFAQALESVFPLRITAIEQGLRQFLNEIDALADRIVPESATSRMAPQLLIATATMLGTERLISELKKRKRVPVLVPAAGKSTWTWVLNLGGTVH